jgi:hypothetical protein
MMTPKEAAFVRMYNQLVGTINGLAPLIRSNRATEAAIDRMRTELPNPYTTKDSADAKRRIRRLLKEIDIAKEKNTFVGMEDWKIPEAKGTPQLPKPGGKSVDERIQDAIKAAGPQGDKVH